MLPFDQTLIIIPTYNESSNVEKMIQQLFELYPKISILVIDDNSPDGTAAIVKKMQEQFGKLFLLERQGKLGLGTAYTTGFQWALDREYQFIFEMDCDFSHDPHEVQNMLAAAKENDLVIGSRYIGGIRIMNWPFKRLLLSYMANVYARMITGMPIFDTTAGFKCFTREALASLNLKNIISNGYAFQIELNFKVISAGFKAKEVPITFHERSFGESKMSGKIIKEALFNIPYLRLKKIFGTLNS